jgi:signal peptidase I
LVLLVAIILCLFRWVLIPIRVSGMSMEPAFKDGKVTVVNHLSYKWSRPKRGDVVAFRYPAGNLVLLKRVVALPGERVRVDDGRVYVNGKLLQEPYLRFHRGLASREIQLEDGWYYVIGDNRGISVSAAIPFEWMLGKVMF